MIQRTVDTVLLDCKQHAYGRIVLYLVRYNPAAKGDSGVKALRLTRIFFLSHEGWKEILGIFQGI